ncbi:hypothetical protein ACFXJ8_12025 [Nonomuraea sp. NPDC059194]|uniref:hypothetical protein n=1 Tax=Nonomuraea sp. NPDC059194 TaxID=3346764 RepID=UPI0036AB2787
MSTAVQNWIRPWYPAGFEGHIYADCPNLLEKVSEPVEGAGWLDPFNGEVCNDCLKRSNDCLKRSDVPSWDAVCETCDSSMKEEWEDAPRPFTEDDAQLWKEEHRCQPLVRLISPDQRKKKQ